MSRILVREGEAFSFKYPVAIPPPLPGSMSISTSRKQLVARLLYGGSQLPSFLSFGCSESKNSRRQEAEFWGTPSAVDVGEVMIGIFDESGICLGKLAVEVVAQG